MNDVAAEPPQFNSVSAAAIAYVEKAGFVLVSFAEGSKGPEWTGWNLEKNCIASLADIQPPVSSIGLMHAYSHTCTIDVDDLPRAVKWFEERGINLPAHINAPDAVRIESGRENRTKLVYRLPPEVKPLRTRNLSRSCGFELRCATVEGLSVQDVLPPSIHPDTGKPYRWVGDWHKLPELPPELLAVWRALTKPRERSASPPERSQLSRQDLQKLLDKIDPATLEYEDWLAAGMALHYELGGSAEGLNAFDDWSKRDGSKYIDREDIETKWASFHSDCDSPVTVGTLERLADNGAGEFDGVPLPEPSADAPPAKMRLHLDWKSLATKAPPPRIWLFEDWLTNAPTLMAGMGGVGKTLLAQVLATALALHKQYLAPSGRAEVVVFWACEDEHDELWRRQVAICNYFGVPLESLEGKLYLSARIGKDNTLLTADHRGRLKPTKHFDELREEVNDLKAGVAFIDNIAQTFGGVENDRHQVTVFCNLLAGLSERPFAPVLLGHPAKATGSEFSGSTAWENAVRMRWYLGESLPGLKPDESEPPTTRVRYLAKRKTNYSEKDYRRLVLRNGVFVPDAPEFDGGEASRQAHEENLRATVLEAVAHFNLQNIRVSEAVNSPDYIVKKMQETGLAAPGSRKALNGVLTRLLSEGKLIVAPVGLKANRMAKTGLSLP